MKGKHLSTALCGIFIACCTNIRAQQAGNQLFSFTAPATQWEETLPLGNGRLGMMPDGGIEKERIVLNEISMWSGSEADYSNPEAANCLPGICQLLFEGKNKEAQQLMYKSFVPRKPESGGTYGNFQLLGNLNIDYCHETSADWKGPLLQRHSPWGGDYSRGLDLQRGQAFTTYYAGGKQYTRTYFVSRDKDVMLIRLQASEPGSITFRLHLDRKERGTVRSMYVEKSVDFSTYREKPADPCCVPKREQVRLKLSGTLDNGRADGQGVKYAAYVAIKAFGKDALRGFGIESQEGGKENISVQRADEAWIIISSATSFGENDDNGKKATIGEPSNYEKKTAVEESGNYEKKAAALLDKVMEASFDGLEDEAVRSYQDLYNRVSLNIKGDPEAERLPINERILRFQNKEDSSLAALYYNYGRYLLISTTREGSLPPNLQGLWANDLQTPWNGDYHLNINVQMNHWPVEPGNLSELHLPLVEFTKGLVKSGEQTAKAFYGAHAQGWVAHMMTNVWQFTAPGEHPSWGATNTGGAWLCAHLWEHYLYTGDPAYLKDIYPVLKGASEFFLSTMVVEPTHGWLVTAPTSSPENEFYIGNDRTPISICMGPTMDNQLVRELFGNVIEAAKILRTDKAYGKQLAAAIEKLPPHQISQEGYLMEWLEDYKEVDVHHRHVSHLYGLHPGNQISLVNTPELAEACRKTLDRRGDGGTGWSRAWKINFWARLGDGNRAYKLFKSLLQPAYTPANPKKHGSGTFPNLFCSHPPFQIDGNWGGTAGIGEMLVQSQDRFINLLPALPDAWNEGEVRGLKVRGGATVDVGWSDGRAMHATITGGFSKNIRVKMPAGCSKVNITQGKRLSSSSKEYIDLTLQKGEKISLSFQ